MDQNGSKWLLSSASQIQVQSPGHDLNRMDFWELHRRLGECYEAKKKNAKNGEPTWSFWLVELVHDISVIWRHDVKWWPFWLFFRKCTPFCILPTVFLSLVGGTESDHQMSPGGSPGKQPLGVGSVAATGADGQQSKRLGLFGWSAESGVVANSDRFLVSLVALFVSKIIDVMILKRLCQQTCRWYFAFCKLKKYENMVTLDWKPLAFVTQTLPSVHFAKLYRKIPLGCTKSADSPADLIPECGSPERFFRWLLSRWKHLTWAKYWS